MEFPLCRLVVVAALFASLPIGIGGWQTAKSLRGKVFLGHFANCHPVTATAVMAVLVTGWLGLAAQQFRGRCRLPTLLSNSKRTINTGAIPVL